MKGERSAMTNRVVGRREVLCDILSSIYHYTNPAKSSPTKANLSVFDVTIRL